MAFKEKNKFGKGRPPGKPNRITGNVREGIEAILNDNADKFKKELDGLKGHVFCKMYIELLPYAAAKHRAIDLKFNFDSLSEPELDKIISGLKEKLL